MNSYNIKIQADAAANYNSVISNVKHHHAREKFFLERFFSEIDENLHITSETSFLEVGFGAGRHLEAWADRYPNAQFLGLEVRESSVNDMQSKGYNCRIVDKEDFTCDETFDVIYGSAVLHHISNPYAYLNHVFKFLKPGGFLYFENENHRYGFFDILWIALMTKNWKYETNLFKISKSKLRSHFLNEQKCSGSIDSSELANTIANFRVETEGLVFMPGFPSANSIYRKLYLHKLPFFNTLKVVCFKSKGEAKQS